MRTAPKLIGLQGLLWRADLCFFFCRGTSLALALGDRAGLLGHSLADLLALLGFRLQGPRHGGRPACRGGLLRGTLLLDDGLHAARERAPDESRHLDASLARLRRREHEQGAGRGDEADHHRRGTQAEAPEQQAALEAQERQGAEAEHERAVLGRPLDRAGRVEAWLRTLLAGVGGGEGQEGDDLQTDTQRGEDEAVLEGQRTERGLLLRTHLCGNQGQDQDLRGSDNRLHVVQHAQALAMSLRDTVGDLHAVDRRNAVRLLLGLVKRAGGDEAHDVGADDQEGDLGRRSRQQIAPRDGDAGRGHLDAECADEDAADAEGQDHEDQSHKFGANALEKAVLELHIHGVAAGTRDRTAHAKAHRDDQAKQHRAEQRSLEGNSHDAARAPGHVVQESDCTDQRRHGHHLLNIL
mmetsp:Transcript_68646/g.174318  ORF Transcript_68646/g.174318 Transcript_68646/m.174318 type:complete len:410 (-) Transcript_68646:626-1855(-)